MTTSKTKQTEKTLDKGVIVAICALGILIVILVAYFIESASSKSLISGYVAASFILNGALAVICFLKSVAEAPFSLSQIHWAFYLTMFVVAPLSQYLNGYYPWDFVIPDSMYIATNVLLFLWGTLFEFVYHLNGVAKSHNSGDEKLSFQYYVNKLPIITSANCKRALAVSVLAILATIALIGLNGMFSRTEFNAASLEKTSGLILNAFIRPIPIFACLIVLLHSKQDGKLHLLPAVMILLALLAVFPPSVARNMVAGLYGGLLLITFGQFLFNKNGFFPIMFLAAFLIVFPGINGFRVIDFSFDALIASFGNVIAGFSTGFLAGDYDAYSIVARSLMYIQTYGSTAGFQLLGALLFFIPRSLWPNKPEGSGHLVCEAQGQLYLNISAPLPAEALVNFGLLGLLLFAIITALICKRIDRWFAHSSSLMTLFYPTLLFMFFFIMRGDLLSSYAYTVGELSSFAFTAFISGGFKRSTAELKCLDMKNNEPLY